MKAASAAVATSRAKHHFIFWDDSVWVQFVDSIQNLLTLTVEHLYGASWPLKVFLENWTQHWHLYLSFIVKKKSHTYTPIHILLMSSALLSRPLVGLASCLKAGNCFHSFFLFSVINVDYGIYNNTTCSSIPQCLYMNVSQTVFL